MDNQMSRSRSDDCRRLLADQLGTEFAERMRGALLTYTLAWIAKVRAGAAADAKAPARNKARQKVVRLGAALEKLGRAFEDLSGDEAFLVTAALRVRRGGDIQRSRRDVFARLLVARGRAIRTAGKQQWNKVKNEDVGAAVYMLAVKYHEVLATRPTPSPGTHFHGFATAALACAKLRPGENFDRLIKSEVTTWLSDNPAADA